MYVSHFWIFSTFLKFFRKYPISTQNLTRNIKCHRRVLTSNCTPYSSSAQNLIVARFEFSDHENRLAAILVESKIFDILLKTKKQNNLHTFSYSWSFQNFSENTLLLREIRRKRGWYYRRAHMREKLFLS